MTAEPGKLSLPPTVLRDHPPPRTAWASGPLYNRCEQKCEYEKGSVIKQEYSHQTGKKIHHDLTECHALVFPFLPAVVQVDAETEPILEVPSREVAPVATRPSPAVNPFLSDRIQCSESLTDSLWGGGMKLDTQSQGAQRFAQRSVTHQSAPSHTLALTLGSVQQSQPLHPASG